MLSAAAFFIAAAFLCMRFYNMSSYKTPENPFSALSESLAEEDGQGGVYAFHPFNLYPDFWYWFLFSCVGTP